MQNPVINMESGTESRWKVLFATFVSYMYDSYDLVILSIAMPVILHTLNISKVQGGMLGTVTSIGAALGGILFGLIAENFGRKRTVLLCLVWFGVFTGAIYLIHTYNAWMFIRFMAGLAVGGVWGPCVAIISEHWAPKYRGRATAFVLSSFAVGAVTASYIGKFSLGKDFRLLFMFGATSILFAIVFYLLVPADKLEEKANNKKANKSGDKVGIADIFKDGYAKTTTLAFLVSFCNMAAYWGIAFWLPTFLTTERGLSLVKMTNFSLIMYIGMFIGYQAWGVFADKYGRKRAMLCSFLTVAVAVVIYTIVINQTFLLYWNAVVGFGLGGAFGVVGTFFSELFPNRIRAYAGGFCWNMGRIGSMLAPVTIGAIGTIYGLRIGILLSGCIYFLAALLLILLPETYKSAEEERVVNS